MNRQALDLITDLANGQPSPVSKEDDDDEDDMWTRPAKAPVAAAKPPTAKAAPKKIAKVRSDPLQACRSLLTTLHVQKVDSDSDDMEVQVVKKPAAKKAKKAVSSDSEDVEVAKPAKKAAPKVCPLPPSAVSVAKILTEEEGGLGR